MSQTPKQVSDRLEKLISDAQKRVEKSIRKLEKELLKKADELSTNKLGDIAPVSIALKQARQFYKKALADYENIYGVAIKSAIDLDAITKLVEDVYEQPLARLTEESLKVAMITTLDGYNSIGRETLDRINQTVLDYVVAGASKADLLHEMSGILSGEVDVNGRNMASRAETFTQDSIMKFNRTANELTAQRAGVKRFLYYGNKMDTTRPFCDKYAGQIKTREEWERIGREEQWAGKSSDNIFIACGGYNCRHHLMPYFE